MPKEIDLRPENISSDKSEKISFLGKIKDILNFRKFLKPQKSSLKPPKPNSSTSKSFSTIPTKKPTPKIPQPPSKPSSKLSPKPPSKPSKQSSKPPSKKTISSTKKKKIEKVSKEFIPDVNLLAREYVLYLKAKRNIKIFIFSILTLILIIISIKGILYFSSSNDRRILSEIQQETDNLNTQLIQYSLKTKDVDEFLERVDSIKELLSQSITWKRFFEFMEKYTLPTVSYNGLSITAGSEFTLTGKALSIEDVYQQLEIYKNREEVESVKLEDVELQKGEVLQRDENGEDIWVSSMIPSFSFKIKLKDDIFYKYPDLRKEVENTTEAPSFEQFYQMGEEGMTNELNQEFMP